MRKLALFTGPVVAAFLLVGCEQLGLGTKQEASLYDRLGGMAAINAVVDDFTARMAGDDRVNKHFAETDIPKFKKLLAEQICEATGGPCTYTGRDMPTTHKGMNITDDEFNITGGHLAASLDKFSVPAKEKNELLTAIGSMKPDIVGK